MPSSYSGNPIYPSDYPLVDDSVAPKGANYNPGLEALGDRTTYLKALADANKCVPVYLEFVGSGFFTTPPIVAAFAFYEGCGGGGAGGKASDSVAAGEVNSGGGGGGGSERTWGIFPIAGGEAYDVSLGAGGSGHVTGTLQGNSGGDTTVTRRSTGDKVVTCRGAGGGHGGSSCDSFVIIPNQTAGVTGNQFSVARGGRPTRPELGETEPKAEPSIYASLHLDRTPQAGGMGVCATWNTAPYGGTQGAYNASAGRPGNPSPEGFRGGVGGTPGTNNTDDLSRLGGGSGGGGGAGPYGNGGDGGSGTHAPGAVGPATSPTGGSAGADNSGAGGGGGGAPGSGSGVTVAGQEGWPGGSGRVRIVYFIPMALP